ncbi:hypothetical protein V1477_003340 [Vespula maculifrons]|uniref:Uncharacterized protein n=1 Tax=Vespula maculifrons TaxID=7453 RepID=A0ABD2CUD8_VESMC
MIVRVYSYYRVIALRGIETSYTTDHSIDQFCKDAIAKIISFVVNITLTLYILCNRYSFNLCNTLEQDMLDVDKKFYVRKNRFIFIFLLSIIGSNMGISIQI